MTSIALLFFSLPLRPLYNPCRYYAPTKQWFVVLVERFSLLPVIAVNSVLCRAANPLFEEPYWARTDLSPEGSPACQDAGNTAPPKLLETLMFEKHLQKERKDTLAKQ